QALEHFDKSLKIREEIGDKKGMAISLGNIGNIYDDQGNYEKALVYCTKALSIAQEIGNVVTIEEASNNLWGTYKKLGKHSQALEMHELYIEMRDSINSEENTKATIRLQLQYEYEKEKALDEARHQQKEKQQQLATLFAAGALALVLVFTLFILNRLKITRRQKNVIEQQKQEVEHKNKEVTDSIEYAKRIQDAVLTSSGYIENALPQNFILYKPRDIVSGDFYWVYQNSQDQVFFTVADCTGHGVPGAFMSMIGSSLLNEIVIENGIQEPDKVLYEIRTHIINSLGQTGATGEARDGMDMALCRLDKKEGKISYAGAYNPLCIIRNGELVEHKGTRRPIGYFLGRSIPFEKQEVNVQEGDMAYIF
ncbi:MAG TPA: tetratricopeptide repeat protein, partial [Flavobacteriales bacterium]|nr:tetratricopeptide repeat protein [Flavobacteriales bacterium]